MRTRRFSLHMANNRTDPAQLSAMDRRVARNVWRSRLLLTGVFVMLAAALAVAYAALGLNRTISITSERLVISPVREEAFHEFIPVTGTVVSHDTTYLDVAQRGQIAEVLVEEGALVHAGQPLMRLKSPDVELEVSTRQTQLTDQLKQLSAAQLSFEQTKLAHERELIEIQFQIDRLSQRLDRQRTLFSSGVVSRADLDDMQAEFARYQRLHRTVVDARATHLELQRTQLDQLQSSIDGMKKNLALARENLASLTITAPASGQLTSLEAHIGESKAPGQRVGQIDRVDSYKAEASVDEFYLNRVAIGQSATVEIDGDAHHLEVAKVYSHVTDRRFKIDLEFANAQPTAIRRGQTLELRLEIGAVSRGLVVDNGPFYEETGGSWAFVLAPSGDFAERRAITLGRRNPDAVEVVSGLSKGERVVTSSYETFKTFDRIRLRVKG